MGITREQALHCFQSDDLVGLGMEAEAVRRQMHPEGVVGYALVARIDCAKLAQQAAGPDQDRVYAAVERAQQNGIDCIRLLGCTDLANAENLLQGIRRRFPSTWIEAVSPTELQSFAAKCQISLTETLERLITAGLNAIAGDAMPLTHESTQSASSTVANWLEAHREAHALGMQTVAGMIFGAGETIAQRVDCLHSIYQLQQQTGGFAAFAPVPAQPPSGRELDGVTAVEHMKTIAIARMFLDNIESIQASVHSQGLKVLQTALHFGANDLGSFTSDGTNSEEDIRRIIRDAGFRPAQRELGYRALLLA